jgi:hypothetical protein
MFGFNSKELSILKRLDTPVKIQAYLDKLPVNFEKQGETNLSPRRVMREQKAHCLEGALLAAAALWLHGKEPLVMDLRSIPSDEDHVIALYTVNGYWGAISKTNHAVLRFRDPVYKTLRELVLSNFHEYFANATGIKSLREYSKPFNMKQLGTAWMTAEENLDFMVNLLDDLPHYRLFPRTQDRLIRKADAMERAAGLLTEWKEEDPRT